MLNFNMSMNVSVLGSLYSVGRLKKPEAKLVRVLLVIGGSDVV